MKSNPEFNSKLTNWLRSSLHQERRQLYYEIFNDLPSFECGGIRTQKTPLPTLVRLEILQLLALNLKFEKIIVRDERGPLVVDLNRQQEKAIQAVEITDTSWEALAVVFESLNPLTAEMYLLWLQELIYTFISSPPQSESTPEPASS